ncbi:uncharacterized protein OCT59_027150 [Rhizophagus irregularis]|uniref:uncharacterized protein n=1 Tax=Rhizophagus irregularis TaxID=588596 RepID=UPI00332BA760|nr:hypothetical protein OCT59_027150 [Rhizophagus irregularis]
MPQEFSEDLCWRIIYLHIDRFSTADIANTLYVSKGFVNKIIRRYNRWACVKNPFKGIPGRRKLFSRADMAVLRNLVAEKADWYLDELVYEMECLTGKRASIAALWRSLQYMGITRKKLHKAALERNDIIRAHYLGVIGEHYTPNQLIFLDESAKDERSLSRLYGYSPRNIRAHKKVVFVRGKRYTILPALTLEGFVAVDIFEGACDRKRFVDFVLDQVVPIMNPYPDNNSNKKNRNITNLE